MTLQIPSVYRRSFWFAVFMQLFAFFLTGAVDDDGSFVPEVAVGWGIFWGAVIALAVLRKTPSKPELTAVRYGPLVVFVVVFTFGQYV